MDPTLIQKLINENGTLRQYAGIVKLIEAYVGFAVGDFLIERQAAGITESFSGSGVPAYFKVVHCDSATGLTFACRILADGRAGKPFCLQGRATSVFELDTNYVNSQLVGETFEPQKVIAATKAELKKRRAYNAKLGVDLRSMIHEEKCAWVLANLTPGAQFWMSYGQSLRCYGPYTVQTTRPINCAHSWGGHSGDRGFVQLAGQTLVIDVTTVTQASNPMATSLRIESLMRSHVVFYLTEPMGAKVNECE